MRLHWIVVVVVAFVLAACSSSPKDDLIDAADAKCQTINERFTSDLAYGDAAGPGKVKQRLALIKDLVTSVRAMPAPDSATTEFHAWLSALDDHVSTLEKLVTMYDGATAGSDMGIAMEFGLADDTVPPIGTAAKDFGLTDCADVHAWVTFPK